MRGGGGWGVVLALPFKGLVVYYRYWGSFSKSWFVEGRGGGLSFGRLIFLFVRKNRGDRDQDDYTELELLCNILVLGLFPSNV